MAKINILGILFWLTLTYLALGQAQAASDKSLSGSQNTPMQQALAEDAVVPAPPSELTDNGIAHQFHGSISAYQDAVVDIENRYGVYDERLTDQLMGLALAHQNQGEHPEAIKAFKRAIHISRINDGLYSLEHAPMLSHLIDSYVAVNDWDKANDKQYLLYQLKARNYGELNPILLESLSKMVEWHLSAYQRGSSMTHLLRAWELNKHAISIIESNFGPDDLRLSEALFRQALTSYHLATLQMSAVTGDFGSGHQHTISMNTPKVPEQDQQFQSMLSPYRDGKTALLRRVELYKENQQVPDAKRAEALVDLGDWYFFFNKRESAIRTYREALEVLAARDETSQYIEQVFGKPHALTFQVQEDYLPKEKSEKKQEGYVEASFDITASGRARDIKILDSNPPEMMDSIVERSIKATRYRPRIVDGKPVLTKGVVYRHIFKF